MPKDTNQHFHLLPPHLQEQIASTLAARFSHFAQIIAIWSGHPAVFLLAAALVVVWIVTGPIFHFSDSWQLVINTGTTIVTFLMVFLIQNTQNRDIMAVQLKLSELVLAMKGAKNEFAGIEDLTDEELEQLHVRSRARVERLTQGTEQRPAHRQTANHKGNHHKRRATPRAKSPRQSSQPGAK